MPTRRGWQVLIASAVSCIVGRILGIRELFELGALLILLVIFAVAAVVRKGPKLSITRFVTNPRPEVQEVVRMVLRIHNPGSRPSPSLIYTEDASTVLGGPIRLAIRPLKGGESRTVQFDCKASHRGVFEVGPGRLSKTDSFGLAHWVHASVEPIRIVVYPITEDLDLVGLPGDLSSGWGRGRVAHASNGKDFYALRQFQDGDDPRKIHWPSTARLGKTMIRQDEQQSQLAVTVLMDLSGTSSTQAERCISSSASLVRSFLNRRHLTRLIDGPPSADFRASPESYDQMMERLAASPSNPETGPTYVWRGLGEGLNVVVCARPHPELVRRIARDRDLAARTLLFVHSSTPSTSTEQHLGGIRRVGAVAIEIPATATLGSVWKTLKTVRRSSSWAHR